MEPIADEVYTLPGGLVLEDGRRLSQAELRPLSGHEEEWLARHPRVPSAVAVTHLLSACLLCLDDQPAYRAQASRLLVGDRDYLMLHLRRLTLGETIRAVLTCQACSAKMDVDFQAADVPVEYRPQTAASYTLDLATGVGPDRSVRFRLPTGADQEAVLGLAGEQAVEVLLARCLLDEGGVALLPSEQSAVIEAMDQLAPQLELELDLVCPECNNQFVTLFDTTLFFLSEMRTNGRQLAREVHHLALHYHWSEAEILSLTRWRRHMYLSLLSESLRSP
jgi:hypothetical protein